MDKSTVVAWSGSTLAKIMLEDGEMKRSPSQLRWLAFFCHRCHHDYLCHNCPHHSYQVVCINVILWYWLTFTVWLYSAWDDQHKHDDNNHAHDDDDDRDDNQEELINRLEEPCRGAAEAMLCHYAFPGDHHHHHHHHHHHEHRYD